MVSLVIFNQLVVCDAPSSLELVQPVEIFLSGGPVAAKGSAYFAEDRSGPLISGCS